MNRSAKSPTTASRSKALAARRRRVLKEAKREHELDAIYVSKREDVGYLSGFTGEDSALLFGSAWSVLITDFRFEEQAPSECPGSEITIRPRQKRLEELVGSLLVDGDVARLGFQAADLSYDRYARLKKASKRRKLEPLEDVFSLCRAVKDDEEIRLTRRAVKIAETALRGLMGNGMKHLVGRTERQLAAEMEARLREAGADRAAFDMIVAAGPNSSMCHYAPGDRVLRPREALLVDWGAEIDGYRSDITRVLFMGEPPAKLREIYPIVLAAHNAAVQAIRPGAQGGRIDAAARNLIDEAGYGPQFGHGLGHGIGREIHELPRFAAESKSRLKKNMIVTVEPGIYLPGIGGIRIEDDFLVTERGSERLNKLPRELEKMIVT